MTAMFEMPIPSETLEPEEIKTITGCSYKSDQIAWLKAAGWNHHVNKAGAPIVGRLYARMKMAGINPLSPQTLSGAPLDFSKVNDRIGRTR